ncbi:Ca2+-transporting ATPase [Methanobrevibacter arboriphilus JCM 13429 = DSM 1125]|uniref:Ca2+-transporting ATPase n=1 Tax=Methanobrevibacter arboriphilus JCM 13429 = DSM 1125 TaxID=1300164 RepID=A0A1V6N0L1_METAZ|nr:cation-translocating P-type ATPase [Methanobrevibacter arboriphilus]OQD58165.1 Ca2+-transporting ATPase [Methanobrevibacter arboriphilus JCM 13429 = DSM 1125]
MTSLDKIFKKYETGANGLTQDEANIRLVKYGKNELEEDEKDHPIKLFFMQFVDILIALLIVAAIAAFFVGEVVDSIVILIVVILNAVIGFIQEYRAEKAMEKLKSLVSTEAVVKRDGEFEKISGTELTIGDIVVVEEGDKIPADLIMIETSDLKIDESSLTGESLPVLKDSNSDISYKGSGVEGNEDAILNIDKSSHDENVRKRFSYMDSNVISGRGMGIVIAIGMNTSIGKIAEMIQDEDTKTPLQEKIANLSKTLGLIAVVVCVLVFALQFFQGHDLVSTFMTAVSLAVAAVPEGLPAILTLTLALGMQQMAKSNAVVRKLLAVETLGSCTVVCTDKTGTLTLNKMTVRDAKFTNEKKALEICALCNNSSIKDGKIIGDPTDAAIMLYGEDNGYLKSDLENKYPRIKEIPLDSVRKRMTTIHERINNNVNNTDGSDIITDNNLYVFSKGAPEIILSLCKYIDNDGTIEILEDETKETISNNIKGMTSSALRVLALAYKKVENNNDKASDKDIDLSYDGINNLIEDPDEVEKDLIFVGLAGMMDPPRQEAKDAVASCKTAGIKVVMITGDHQSTASSIAQEIGIFTDGKVLTGAELDKLDENQFMDVVQDVQVYARVYPEQKVRIVEALQKHKNVVSMTGDGVNDAPALKKASIGVAMGSGTDVSKESSDMIIQDDNFATIVQAIKEGRKIFDNIKRFVKFQVSTNVGAILTIVSASLLSLPVPFNPIQILWINIIMDGPPAQSLGTEGAEDNIMNRAPEKGNILNKNTLTRIIIAGVVMAVGTLALYFYELSSTDGNIKISTTVAFTVFVMYQLFNAINNRANSNEKNNFFWIAISISFLLQLLVIYLPYLQGIFRTTAIGITEWILIVIVAATILASEKILNRFMTKN